MYLVAPQSWFLISEPGLECAPMKSTTYTDIHTNVSIYTGNGTNWYKKENNIESPKNKTHPILHLSHEGEAF